MLKFRTRAKVGAVLGSVLALAMAGSTFAANPQQVVIQSYVSVTGVPASMDFGSTIGGTALPAIVFTATVSSNNATGYVLSAHSGTLIGPATISQSAQTWKGTQGTGCNITCTDGTSTAMPNTGAGASVTLGSRTAASSASGDQWSVSDILTPPAGLAPGTYVGNDTNSQGFTVTGVTQ